MTSPASIPEIQTTCLSVRPHWRRARLAAVCLLALIGVACGDQYRPVALPIPVNTPNPQPAHFMAFLSSNGNNVLNSSGTCSPSGTPPPCIEDQGTVSRIDVSGDSVSSAFKTGLAPVHAAFLPNGSKIYVANSGEDTISSSSSSSFTSTSSPSSTTQAVTISLPQLCSAGVCVPSRPVFLNSTENGKMYVANSGNGTVSVINATSDVVVATVAVDPAFAGSPLPTPNPAANPVALAELPNGFKIYSVNQGNSSGTISVIDTLSDAVVSASTSVGAGANYMFLDALTHRLFVTNPTSSAVSIFDVAGSILISHAGSPVAIAAAAGSACASAPQPTAVNVLGDGSRAYVASFQADPSGAICTQASVINSGTGLVTAVIPLSQSTDMSSQTGCSSARFRVFVASSSGAANSNFKVYVSQCDAGSVAVIDTFASNSGTNQHGADVLGATLSAPLSGFAPLTGQVSPPFQNPVFVVAGR